MAPDFDAGAFCDSSATLYICATGRHQAVAAPLVVGLLTDIRSAAYARSATPDAAGAAPHDRRPPVVLALDEVANIAPVPDLPGMVSEGAGQGLLTLACLQDLSQARGRWGAGRRRVPVVVRHDRGAAGDRRRAHPRGALGPRRRGGAGHPVGERPGGEPRGHGGGAGAVGARAPGPAGRAVPTVTTSTVMRRRLPVDVVARGETGMALVVDERNRMGWVRLTPWFATEPWRSAALGTPSADADARSPGPTRAAPRRAGPELGRDVGLGGL